MRFSVDRIAARAVAIVLLGLPGGTLAVAEGESEANPPPRPLAVGDYARIADVEDPRLSPDGEWIAYTVTTADLEADELSTRIWRVPAAGGTAEPLTSETESSSSPRWSPDGRFLAFLSRRGEGPTEVWTLSLRGGEAVRRTDTAQGVEALEWSPDSRRMVLVMQDARPEQIEAKKRRDAGEPAKEETPPPHVIDRLQFKEDYEGYLDRYRAHLYVLDLDSGRMRQVTSGDYEDSEPAWSPDGRTLAFVSDRSEEPDASYNTDLWLVPADSPDQGASLLQLTRNRGAEREPAWSPDGKWLTYGSVTNPAAIDYATFNVGVVSAIGESERALTAELDRVVYEPRFSPDGKWIYFVMEDGSEQPLARVPAGGGAVERLIRGADTVVDYDIGARGTVVVELSRPQQPSEVFTLAGGKLDQRTHVNDELLAGLALGAVEKIRYSSPDGTPIEGFVVKPVGFQEGLRYPVVLWIHGGPMAQYDYRFDFEPQLWAANGYLVVMPNPRGSTGYGEPFTLAIWRQWGVKDYEDVMAGVDYVIERGWGDPERMGVGGWSYGGMLTNHVITRTDRFEGAITGASAALYVVNYGHDQYQRWWDNELGLPWEPEARSRYDAISPFNRVENVVTPTLIVCGEEDWNVPVINSEQLYLALKRLGKAPTQLVVYPGEYHGFQVPSNSVDLYRRYLAWFAEHVKGVAS
jgi:dipeptidyl aminopeptidase/acylaminoacyl peptidase